MKFKKKINKMESYLKEQLVKVICIKSNYKNNLMLSLTKDDISIINDDSLNDMVLSYHSYKNDEFLQSWLHGERWSEVIKFTSEKNDPPGGLVILNIGKIKKDIETNYIKVVKTFTVFLWTYSYADTDIEHYPFLKTYLKYDQYLLN